MNLLTIDDTDILGRRSNTLDYMSTDTPDILNKITSYAEHNKIDYLSAIQLGIPKKIIYFASEIIINPVITNKMGLTYIWTSCLSCQNYISLVPYPYLITIEYLNINGNIQTKTFEYTSAARFMHMYDHLNGYLPIDKALVVKSIPLNEQEDFLSHNHNIIVNKTEVERPYIKKLTKK